MFMNEPIRMLSPEEMEAIHTNAVRILDEVGIRLESDEAIDYLVSGGCRANRDKHIVTFPPDVVNRWVDTMRSDYDNPDRKPEKMSVRYSHIKFRKEPHHVYRNFSVNTGGFCCFIYDLEGNRRNADIEDVRRSINLAHHLEHITYMGLPVSAQEVPHTLRPVTMAAELVKRTSKLGGVETFRRSDVGYITEIAEIAAGGKKELRENPILVGYGEVRSPLCIDANMAEIMIEYIKLGLPQSLDTMPNAGATAPATAAGVLALGVAETLAGLVLGYCVDENAFMSIDVCPSFVDMSSGLYRYFSPERGSLLSAQIQMIAEYYGCPSGTHGGKTDSCYFNIQTGMDKALSMLMPVLAGSCGVGVVGQLENAVTFSPVQLVIDNEIAGFIKNMLKGIDVNEDTLAFDTVKEVGPGGEFMTSEHTLNHFRKSSYFSELWDHLAWSAAHADTHVSMIERAAAKAEELMNRDPEPVLSKEQEAEIDEVVKRAEMESR